MSKRCIALFIFFAVLASLMSVAHYVEAETPSFQSLGSITYCTVDDARNMIKIHGSIKHSVLISKRDAKIAVYRFDPWEDVVSAITTAEPMAMTDMSISFDFELSCTTVLDKTSVYAVALIESDGKVSFVTAPTYPDAETKDTSDAGFKAILTSDHASALSALPGSAIVDVYLDKLNNNNNSGYIQNADGELFYFDKAIVNELDRIIRSYSAAGTKVYMRFLISPSVTSLPFCSDAVAWATNKCIVIDDEASLSAIYAYTAFLTSRYSGGDYGRVDGIILGRGADVPILYNYASLVSEDYNTVYARSLTIIGLAASSARISLLVPIGDTLTTNSRVNGEEFLYAVADYVETYSNLKFTVLCESRHNPYGITDDFFRQDVEPEITDAPTETAFPHTEVTGIEATEECVTTESTVVDDSTYDSGSYTESPLLAEADKSQMESTAEPSEIEWVVTEPSPKENANPNLLQKNNNSAGFFCTDNIEAFQRMFEKLKRSHSSVNKGFGWCWYPDANTVESSLSVCYSYNYMKLAALNADFYAVGFENDISEHFSSMAHLFKYVDTQDNVKETIYARDAFGVDDWGDLIDQWSEQCGVYSSLQVNEFETDVSDFSGELSYLSYSSAKGAVDWYNGYFCNNISLQNNDGSRCLTASIEPSKSGFAPAEIGYVLDKAEPLLVGDALTFDIRCGSNDGSIYEVIVYINHTEGTLISKGVLQGGERCKISADVSEYDSTTLVNSIRIAVNRITGDGPYDFCLYNVAINDYSDSNALLAQKLEDVRNYLRTNTKNEDPYNRVGISLGVAISAGVGVLLLAMAYGNDRKNKSSDS